MVEAFMNDKAKKAVLYKIHLGSDCTKMKRPFYTWDLTIILDLKTCPRY